jgi:hypothetical protein
MSRRLQVRFESAEEFERELARNISKGGVFVPGASGLELRDVVEVEIALEFAGERRCLEAEVVHVAPGAGVALQLLRPAADVREELAGLLAGASEPAWQLPGADTPAIDRDLFGAPLAPIAPAPAEERRRTPRARARIPALLDGANARIEGITRDLSETGALISADASELPPGKRVRLQLRHPDTGLRVEVPGRVARHLETEGTVAAVSIDFELAAEAKPQVAALVQAAAQVQRERAAAGISGRIEELGMANLIQMLGSSSERGTLSVASGAEEGVVAFETGSLRYACLGAMRGVKALTRLLQWRSGSFEFHAQVDPLEVEGEPVRLELALLEATRRLDESARADATRLEPRLRFRLDRDALAAAGALSKVEEAVLELAGVGLTVRRILDVVPEDDAQVSEALLALIERGVLLPRR